MDNMEIKSRDYIINKYLDIYKLHENRVLVKDRNFLYGYIDSEGEEPISCKYAEADDFNEGLAFVMDKNGNRFFINPDDNKVFDCNQYKIFDKQFSNGLLPVMQNQAYGFIDNTGKESISCKYGYADNFHEGMALVATELFDPKERFFIDKNDTRQYNISESNDYHFAFRSSYFNNGIAPIFDKLDKLYGYITKDGKILTENLEQLTVLHNLKPEYLDIKDDIKKKFITYCSEIIIFNQSFTLMAPTENELKNKKEGIYLYIHEMIVAELQKLTLQDEKEKQKHLK